MQAYRLACPWWLSGSIALLVVGFLTLLPLASLLLEAGSIPWKEIIGDTYTQRIIRFSFFQAVWSTILSLALAVPVALALAHTRPFLGRNFIVTLFSLSLVIPTIVAIYGIVAVFGRSGWVNTILVFSGFDAVSLYGLPGILIAHVFFNMPLATRVLLISLETIPAAHWRLARQLGMRPMAVWRLIEWPALRSQLLGLALLIFTLCFTSFAIVLTLGGGPRSTTIEVAIYQALRFDFDISRAVALACVQLGICLILTLLSALFSNDTDLGFQSITRLGGARAGHNCNLQEHTVLWHGACRQYVRIFIIVSASAFVLMPLAALLISGFNEATVDIIRDPGTLRAIINTGLAAISSAIIALALALGILVSARHLRIRLRFERSGQWLQLAGNVILIIPPVVLGTGLFLVLRRFADVFSLALLLVIVINSLMALPFALRVLDAPVMRAANKHDRLVRSLGIQGISRWRIVDWPLLRKPVGLAFALSATLSAGDLTAIALFGSERLVTLPLLLYQRMGSYRLDAAAVTATLLLLLCLCLFLILQRLIGGGDHADT